MHDSATVVCGRKRLHVLCPNGMCVVCGVVACFVGHVRLVHASCYCMKFESACVCVLYVCKCACFLSSRLFMLSSASSSQSYVDASYASEFHNERILMFSFAHLVFECREPIVFPTLHALVQTGFMKRGNPYDVRVRVRHAKERACAHRRHEGAVHLLRSHTNDDMRFPFGN